MSRQLIRVVERSRDVQPWLMLPLLLLLLLARLCCGSLSCGYDPCGIGSNETSIPHIQTSS